MNNKNPLDGFTPHFHTRNRSLLFKVWSLLNMNVCRVHLHSHLADNSCKGIPRNSQSSQLAVSLVRSRNFLYHSSQFAVLFLASSQFLTNYKFKKIQVKCSILLFIDIFSIICLHFELTLKQFSISSFFESGWNTISMISVGKFSMLLLPRW